MKVKDCLYFTQTAYYKWQHKLQIETMVQHLKINPSACEDFKINLSACRHFTAYLLVCEYFKINLFTSKHRTLHVIVTANCAGSRTQKNALQWQMTYPVFVCVRDVINFRWFWKNNEKAQCVPFSIAWTIMFSSTFMESCALPDMKKQRSNIYCTIHIVTYILESNPHPNLIRTSSCRFLKWKKVSSWF